jgi:Domain of unknown function (DUF4279)
VDRFRITLRISGADLVPDLVTSLLHCQPTVSEVKGVATDLGRIPKEGRWSLTIDSKNSQSEDMDVEDGLKILLHKLPADPKVWEALTARYEVDIFCGLFLGSHNRGFGLSPEMLKLLANRSVEIGFDIYFDPPAEAP